MTDSTESKHSSTVPEKPISPVQEKLLPTAFTSGELTELFWRPHRIIERILTEKERLVVTVDTEQRLWLLIREPDTVFKWTFPILLFIRGNWVFEHPQMSILLFNKIRVLSKRMSGPRNSND